MRRRRSRPSAVVLGIVLLSGCARPLALTYESGTQPADAAPGLQARRIAVVDFVDDRDDMRPNTFGIEMVMITAEVPIATADQLEADRLISEYVTTAFKDELKAAGAQVLSGGSRVDFTAVPRGVVDLGLHDVHRVIVGRIRFFEWTQAGFAGLLFQAAMPKPQVNMEIQVQVADAKTGEVLWAGDGWVLDRRTSTFPNEEERASALRAGLR